MTPNRMRVRIGLITLSMTCTLSAGVPIGFTQSPPDQMRMDFRPHCETGNEIENVFGGPLPDSRYLISTTDGRCPPFAVRDPASRKTDELSVGDILDYDIVLDNPGKQSVDRFRAWIAYDPSVMEGVDIAINPLFDTPMPGEMDFVPSEGYIKLSGEASSGQKGAMIPLARVRMRVLSTDVAGTPLTFNDLLPSADSHTGAFGTVNGQEINYITQPLGYLYVRFAQAMASASSAANSTDTSAQSAASLASDPFGGSAASTGQTTSDPFAAFRSSAGNATQSAVTSTQASSAPLVTPTPEIFSLLRVNGLRVGTEGSTAYLAWDALPSAQLAGYNVYYGTVSGRYLQRRSVDAFATSLSIRGLPENTTYYFAIRGINAQGDESDFSNEVSVTIGQPSTSTSPLGANMIPTPTPDTDGSVSGDTGPASLLLVFLAISAVIGTTLAMRRQLSSSPVAL